MKRKDFIKLINLKTEYKEYVLFDASKSKKYKTYAEWDTHIESILRTIESPTDMYNLKRYCMDVVRSGYDVEQIFWGYLGLAFPLLLAFSAETDRIGFRGTVFSLCLLALLFYIIRVSTASSRKKHFYQDMLTIIEQIETNKLSHSEF